MKNDIENKTLLFRFIPTMRCNFNCEYCFLSKERNVSTMFDEHPVEEWVNAMEKFSEYSVEPYMWGGEPFCVEETYRLLKEWVKMEHIVSGFRIDTNTFFAEKIVRKCPSNKIKMNCSYHMQYHTLEEQFRKVKLLKDYDMVGMVNFVASPYNLKHLRNDYNMTVIDLIDKFREINVFVNVAGDFAFANNVKYERYKEYQAFIQQFISPDEWKWLRGVKKTTKCDAGEKFFFVANNGELTSCIDREKTIRGNFFEGIIEKKDVDNLCNGGCPSIIQYPFRRDNDYKSYKHLLSYIERNMIYRESRKESYFDFVF